jgi:hypothetical protein
MSKTTINELEVNGQTYVLKGTDAKPAEKLDGMDFVIVRTYSAGVFAGYLKERDGKEATIVNAIRLWYWSGAASLSQLATDGPKNTGSCKFGVPVSQITVTEAIEIVAVTEKAQKVIQETKSWTV